MFPAALTEGVSVDLLDRAHPTIHTAKHRGTASIKKSWSLVTFRSDLLLVINEQRKLSLAHSWNGCPCCVHDLNSVSFLEHLIAHDGI